MSGFASVVESEKERLVARLEALSSRKPSLMSSRKELFPVVVPLDRMRSPCAEQFVHLMVNGLLCPGRGHIC